MDDKRFSWFQGWKRVAIIYIGLLFLSHVWQYLQPDNHDLEPGQQHLTVNQVEGDSVLTGKPLKIAYRDEYRGDEEKPPVILLLHGSPVGVPFLPELVETLSARNRVIAPDFPGYDASSREIPDYSMKSFSVYMDQVLDSLEIDRAHLVGYSMGAGVAIQMSHLFPERVSSIVMLSGIGVQELELLGSYHLNHAVHGGQLFLVWLMHEAIPHFGLLSDIPVNVPYARTFYDSDQRPLRTYLKQYKKPMLIQHGKEDGLVPLAAANEHHRLVPQSKLILYEGGHAIVKTRAGKISGDINEFIRQVETGQALTYSEAPEERVRESQKPFKEINFAKVEGLTLYILMLIIIFSTFISEDLGGIGAGLLAARGIIGFVPATLACFMGIVIGDFAIFLIGRWIGKPAIRRAPFRWFVSEKDLERSADWFKVRGPMIIIGSRFIPGSRFPTYFSAGMIGMRLFMFAFYFLLAGILWTPLLVGISMLVGTELLRYFQVYQEYAIWVIPVIILLLFLFVKFILPAVTWRGRRMVLSRWRRLTRWEYWSPYIIYAPICCYIAYLGIKHRSLTVFTAANPGIPGGGFIGESKSDILEGLKASGVVPAFRKISSDLEDREKVAEAEKFIEEQQLNFPVIAKPDVGQRGTGVKELHDEEQLREMLQGIDYELIIQEYASGEEFGIFYYRYPEEERGSILSITKKRLLTLTGDGEHTLEELILRDDEAVSRAKIHLREHQDHLYEVPEKGEKIPLVRLGVHARGARFFDATHLATRELAEQVDDITSHLHGFYFGRLDVRVPSKEKLKNGENIKVLEVNGVTSESTIIYDPQYTFFQAQKMLRNQWRIAFEIGGMNRERGHKPDTVTELIQRVIDYRSR
ncbi:alpha/beta fold hydrolase [Halalkalibaculum sp. DA3122]|uniref:alpha/beta fold hydrolase n=1 Tax=unclassified Halalkalibaculum TaxID=2964617 RepID=UPI0037545E7E